MKLTATNDLFASQPSLHFPCLSSSSSSSLPRRHGLHLPINLTRKNNSLSIVALSDSDPPSSTAFSRRAILLAPPLLSAAASLFLKPSVSLASEETSSATVTSPAEPATPPPPPPPQSTSVNKEETITSRIYDATAIGEPMAMGKDKKKVWEYCYDTLDPLTSKAKVDHIRKKIKKLYGVYKKDPNSTTASPSEATLVNSISAGYGNAGTGKSALDVYLAEPVLDMAAFKTLDVLRYWKNNATRFKELSRMACDVLSIPITTVSSESSFSAGSRVLSKYRSRLLPSNVQALICGRNWLRGFEVTSDSDEEEEEEEKEGEEKEGEEEGGRKKRSK